jgi:hypothetical protein
MRVIAGLACACGLLAAPTASAHHSLAIFATSAPVKLEGKVTRVEWRSPHTIIFVETQVAGVATEWRVETMANSSLMRRAGWTIDSVKPGEHVTVEMYGHGDRRVRYGFLLRIIKADGKVWASPVDIGRREQREPSQ